MILSYTVGQAEILESPGLESDPSDKGHLVFTRTLDIGRSPKDLWLRVAPLGTEVALARIAQGNSTLISRDGYTMLHIAAAATPLKLKLLMRGKGSGSLQDLARTSSPPTDLKSLTTRGPLALARAVEHPGRDRP